MRRFLPIALLIPYLAMYLGTKYDLTLLTMGAFLVWAVLAVHILSSRTKLTRLPYSRWFATIVLFCGFTITHTLVYLLFYSTIFTLLLTLGGLTVALIIGTVIWPYQTPLITFDAAKKMLSSQASVHSGTKIRDLLMFIIISACQIALIYTTYTCCTYGALVSPWQTLGNSFLVVYTITTFCLLFFAYTTTRHTLAYILISVHYILTFGIVAILYPLGFGYDPFLHRATEQHIFSFGFASPKNPFYIGQYVIVNLIAHLTTIPLKIIDMWLVPFLTCTLIPTASYIGFRYGWKLSERVSRIGMIVLPILPLETFYVTTPHNVANILLFTTLLLLPATRHNKYIFLPLVFIALTAVSVHPLTGIFAIFAIVLFWINHGSKILNHFPKTRIWLFLCTLAAAIVSVATFFAIFLYLRHVPLPHLGRILTNYSHFLPLIQEPYYYSHKHVPVIYDIIYAYKLFLPLIIVLTLLVIYIKLRKERNLMLVIGCISLACISNAFLLTTWLEIPALSSYEQLQYGERLMHAAFFSLIPITLGGCLTLLERQLYKSRMLLIIILPIFAILLTVSLYLTYPQSNPKVRFPGFNVTQADIDAATYIANNSPTSTIILSNILTAAASVEKYGFQTYYNTDSGPVFYYAIPSGGPLADAFNDMLYKGQKRETMDRIMTLAGVKHGYFIVHSYWDDADRIIAGANQNSDRTLTISSGNTTLSLFRYDAASNSK